MRLKRNGNMNWKHMAETHQDLHFFQANVTKIFTLHDFTHAVLFICIVAPTIIRFFVPFGQLKVGNYFIIFVKGSVQILSQQVFPNFGPHTTPVSARSTQVFPTHQGCKKCDKPTKYNDNHFLRQIP